MSSGPGGHWFEELADHMGAAYLRYSFTKGTVQEVDALVDALGLEPGRRVLDVGCGPGRHCLEMARRGIEAHGVDISSTFIGLAVEAAGAERLAAATFERADAGRPADPHSAPRLAAGGFDAAISLCQGAFGLGGPGPFAGDPHNLAHERSVLALMVRAVRPGGRVAVSAFSAYFQVRFLEERDRFDAATAVNAERTEVRDPTGDAMPVDLWTTCMTPRELALLADGAGLVVDEIWSVTPGDYRRRPADLDRPEFLLLATVAP